MDGWRSNVARLGETSGSEIVSFFNASTASAPAPALAAQAMELGMVQFYALVGIRGC